MTDFQRAERVRICQENLAKFAQGTWRLCDVVTGDGSWFYHKQIGRKSSNAARVGSGDPPPTLVRRSRFAPRTLFCIFFKSTGPLLIHSVERGQTILITNITSIIVCSQLLTKSETNDPPLVLMESNFTMIMGNRIFIKMY